MDALAKLQQLYNQRDSITKQIEAIGELLGLDKEEPVKQKRLRGPNKKKDKPPEPPKLVEQPKSVASKMAAATLT